MNKTIKSLTKLMFTLTIACAIGLTNDLLAQDPIEICVEYQGGGRYVFKVQNFEYVRTSQFAIRWDTSYATFQDFSLVNFSEEDLSEFFFFLDSPGVLRHLWFTPNSISSASIPDGEAYAVLDLATTDPLLGFPYVVENGDPIDIEFGDTLENLIPVVLPESCNADLRVLTGRIALDGNQDCQVSDQEPGLTSYLLSVSDGSSEQLVSPDIEGRYYAWLESGTYELSLLDLGQPPSNQCIESQSITIPTSSDTTNVDWAVGFEEACPLLEVQIGLQSWDPCDTSQLYLTVNNQGSNTVQEQRVDVFLPEGISWISSELPSTMITENHYQINVGQLQTSSTLRAVITIAYSCDVEMLSTPCIIASLSDPAQCEENSAQWSGANIVAQAACNGNEVSLTVTNESNSMMNSPIQVAYFVNEELDNTEMLILGAMESHVVNYPNDGSTYRVIAEQVDFHPDLSFPTAAIEGCATSVTNSWGFRDLLAEDDEMPWRDALCLRQATEQFSARPRGLQEANYVSVDRALTYRLQYRHTGSDTLSRLAWVCDLDSNLDVQSLHGFHANRDLEWQLQGQNQLQVVLNSADIAPMGSNPDLSEIFIEFSVRPQTGTRPGTEILQSGIVLLGAADTLALDTLLRTVYVNYEDIVLSTENIANPQEAIRLYPNPTRGNEIYVSSPYPQWRHVRWYNSVGQLVDQGPVNGHRITRSSTLRPGLYWVQLISHDGRQAVASVVLQ